MLAADRGPSLPSLESTGKASMDFSESWMGVLELGQQTEYSCDLIKIDHWYSEVKGCFISCSQPPFQYPLDLHLRPMNSQWHTMFAVTRWAQGLQMLLENLKVKYYSFKLFLQLSYLSNGLVIFMIQSGSNGTKYKNGSEARQIQLVRNPTLMEHGTLEEQLEVLYSYLPGGLSSNAGSLCGLPKPS